MCNYSQLIKEDGFNAGIQIGREDGKAEGKSEGIIIGEERGRKEGLSASICSLMENLKIDMPEAMRLLNIPESDYPIYQKMMKISNN